MGEEELRRVAGVEQGEQPGDALFVGGQPAAGAIERVFGAEGTESLLNALTRFAFGMRRRGETPPQPSLTV